MCLAYQQEYVATKTKTKTFFMPCNQDNNKHILQKSCIEISQAQVQEIKNKQKLMLAQQEQPYTNVKELLRKVIISI